MNYHFHMQIIVASSNQHKLKELQELFPEDELSLPPSFECEENGTTFIENALIKAHELQNLYPDAAILADDSGLIVEALPGQLGIHTARYGSEEAGRMLSASEKNSLLVKNLAGASNRNAHFVCALVFVQGKYRTFIAQESIDGTIVDHETGTNGFGYDPVFYIPKMGCTTAELPEGEKNEISHRGRAARRIRVMLDTIRGENR